MILTLMSQTLTGQELVHRSHENAIELKWYSQQFLYAEGVNVLRKESGSTSWHQLNGTPIKQGDYRPEAALLRKDSTLNEMIEVVGAGEAVELEGVPLLNFVVKSFQSNEFAQFLGIFYRDETIQNGVTYDYRIENAVTKAIIAEKAQIVLNNDQKLLPPKNITHKQRAKKLSLSWTPETSRYYAVDVYRKSPESTAFIKVNDLPVIVSESAIDTQKTDFYDHYQETIPKIKGEFQYKLKAIGFFAESSDFSEVVRFQHKYAELSPIPQYFHLDSAKHQDIYLGWKPVTHQQLKGYKIYTSDRDSGQYVPAHKGLLNPDRTTMYFRAKRSGDHYFKIASVTHAEDENLSDYILAVVEDMFPPEQLKGLKAVADSMRMTVSWSASKAKDLMGYQLFRSVHADDTTSFVLLNATPVVDTFYVDEFSKRLKTAMSFRVVAVDSSWNKSKFSDAVTAKLIDVVPPSIPYFKNITVTPTGALKIDWVANREPDFDHYELVKSYGSTSEVMNVGDVVTYRDSLVQPATQYTYQLMSVDDSGNFSALSKPFRITTPQKVKKETENIVLKVKNKKSKTILKWKFLKSVSEEELKGFVIYEESGKKMKPITGLLQNTKFILGTGENNFVIKAFLRDGTVYRSALP